MGSLWLGQENAAAPDSLRIDAVGGGRPLPKKGPAFQSRETDSIRRSFRISAGRGAHSRADSCFDGRGCSGVRLSNPGSLRR